MNFLTFSYRKLTHVPLAILMMSIICIGCDQVAQETDATEEVASSAHPQLILTQTSINQIRSRLGDVPLFDKTLEKAKNLVDAAIEEGVDVPVPKDMAGGYTHTQHKKNYSILQKAGVLFQITGDEKYAKYVRDVLMEYASLYPTLPLHPQERSYARGKIFWQCLNDANWLVYMSQAYDCIYDWLPSTERETLNKDLFKPFADFLSVGSPQFFNRIHNHSTWGNVGVGMIGLVMDDEELVNRALYGLKEDNISADARDNDGGLIKTAGQPTGFLANLDHPFSPDGFYTEGPYYQRYAMYPFMIFAQALENKKPDLKIFEYKDGVLIKAVDALLNLTDEDGEFFPLNDGQKGMSYHNGSLVSAVDIAYFYGSQDAKLLSVAKAQGEVQLDASGMAVAVAIKDGKTAPFDKKSMLLRDGANGDAGSIAMLRTKNETQTMALVMKNTSHGLSHGHFDKMSFSLYENGEEVLQDYGLARYVNVEQKNGGGYLKENKTWAKQTIAHNTIVQDRNSHFQGDIEESSKNHPEVLFFNSSDPKIQVVSAQEKNAYPGTKLTRTMFLITEDNGEQPFIIDVNQITSGAFHDYDLPYYYFGQIIATDFDLKASQVIAPLGSSNGYQHLWKEAEGTFIGSSQFTWLSNNKFYSISSATTAGETAVLGRIGANDPKFNLRRDPVYILQKRQVKNAVFASIIESHGTYDPVSERAENAYSRFKKLELVGNDDNYLVLEMTQVTGDIQLLLMVKDTAFADQPAGQGRAQHKIENKGKLYTWEGPYSVQLINK